MTVRAAVFASSDTVMVEERVSTELEATGILLRHPRSPVHFLDLDGREAVANLWSDRDRIAQALNMDREGLMQAILQALSHPQKARGIDDPPFMYQEWKDFDLRELPIPRFYPGDGGRYVTSAVAVSQMDGVGNLSFHRMMLLDQRSFGIRLVPRHLYTMYRTSLERGEDLPVAFCFGVCPSILLAAASSVDYHQDEIEIASAIRTMGVGEPVEVANTPSGITVPAHSEMVMEGRITADTVEEGPFVDITGTYDRVREQPVVEIDRVYHRDHPLFHIVLPGGLEHFLLMGMPREPVIYRTVGQAVPRVHAVRLTEGGCCWLHGVVSVSKNKEGDGKNAIMAAFTGHPSMKSVIVVDADVDVHDDRQVEWAMATRFQGDRDLVRVEGAAGSSLDPSSPGRTTKLGFDATKPIGSVEFDRASL
ncbi:MAG: UbiD family decarboxylase [Methanomassiliicoccales archaeon]